jgi:hypothetical protein
VERARLLLGCYRTGEANDPETYVAAIAATLSRFPEEVVTQVTHPATGLPAKKGWLPTVKEVHDACEQAAEPIIQQELREKRIAEQLAAREEEERMRAQPRPTLEQMREKYGENWGIPKADERPKSTFKAPSLEELQHFYARNPERVARLMGEQGDGS